MVRFRVRKNVAKVVETVAPVTSVCFPGLIGNNMTPVLVSGAVLIMSL